MRRAPAPMVVQGPEGERGPRGKDGKSAYELAVDSGFSGSLVEWLESLKAGTTPVRGPRGEKGEPGDQGPAGVDGKDAAAVLSEPEFPLAARFERDDKTKLTTRLLVEYPSHLLAIVPQRDSDGYIGDVLFSAERI